MASDGELSHLAVHAMCRDYAWKYFSLHADQRLKTFHFYLILATVIVGAFATLVKDGRSLPWLSILPFLLAFVSFIFWKLDKRNQQLVTVGESALRLLDDQLGLECHGKPHPLKLFEYEEYLTEEIKRSPTNLVDAHYTYTKCFHMIFVTFGWAGALLGVTCLLHGSL
jgi:hypothetical protein